MGKSFSKLSLSAPPSHKSFSYNFVWRTSNHSSFNSLLMCVTRKRNISVYHSHCLWPMLLMLFLWHSEVKKCHDSDLNYVWHSWPKIDLYIIINDCSLVDRTISYYQFLSLKPRKEYSWSNCTIYLILWWYKWECD